VGIEKRLPTFLTEDEVARMMTKPRSPRTRAFMELLYSCGLRNGEVRGLKLSDIIGDRLRVLGKGSKERIVPLSSSASSALKAYIAVRPESGSPLVFVTISGTKVHHQQIKEMVTRLAAAAGIKRRITPHTLRHSIATHMLNRGMDLRYVAEFLGHGDLSTTMIYTHIATEQLNQKVHQFHPDFAAKGDA
jgi:integrase/recombinase XerD